MTTNIPPTPIELDRAKNEMIARTKHYYDLLANYIATKPLKMTISPNGSISTITDPDDEHEKSIEECIAYIESSYRQLFNANTSQSHETKRDTAIALHEAVMNAYLLP